MGGHCFCFIKNYVTLDNIKVLIRKEGCLIDTTVKSMESVK